MNKGDRVISVIDEEAGTVVEGGACPTVKMDDGRTLRGDFRSWIPFTGSAEDWENGILGASEKHARISTTTSSEALDRLIQTDQKYM